ncbi:hypothetical protein Q763_13345 [Flavobacterium beibuense F44-8]|uniref:DUF4878 domain-containing protein n=1 Tax=Flavobacterium beibuense F44-8 TaxID=1406840 RepID=A0A0A2LTM7_9FLAO|nr:DUF4878 domain-containing protein [Flavobacterium beibuense]KGO79530.1 hypothetical protein Q763_13345 [Flavobacterium beibuense F44-8]
MKQLKLAALALVLSLSLSSCSGNGPEDTAKKFIEYTNQGKFSKAKELSTDKTAAMLGMAEGFAQGKMEEMKEKNKDVKVEITSSEVNEDKATVKFKLTGGENTSGSENQLNLVKVDGEWKVDMNKEGAR